METPINSDVQDKDIRKMGVDTIEYLQHDTTTTTENYRFRLDDRSL